MGTLGLGIERAAAECGVPAAFCMGLRRFWYPNPYGRQNYAPSAAGSPVFHPCYWEQSERLRILFFILL